MNVSIAGPLEAVLFAAGSNGLSTGDLAHILQLPPQEVLALCEALMGILEKQGISGNCARSCGQTGDTETRRWNSAGRRKDRPGNRQRVTTTHTGISR